MLNSSEVSPGTNDYVKYFGRTVRCVASPTTTLSAAYAAAGKTKQNGYYKLQDMNSSICGMVDVTDDELQVIDTRDNKVYWIAKLKDGHCWMTQNLDLDLGIATLTHNSTTLHHDDTDIGCLETLFGLHQHVLAIVQTSDVGLLHTLVFGSGEYSGTDRNVEQLACEIV